jgi:ABC-type branched-subunit amino acid transport system substrate-binding protein
VAPLATDEAVSAGRSYVFQANPTIEMRGRQMARFAARGLLMDMTGLLVEDGNAISERMARGFKAEAREQGMGVLFETVIDNPREWSNLPEKVRRDTLGLVDAVYLPIAGRDAGGRIQDALTGLERLRTDVRVLGNAEWHDLAVEQQASAFNATYTNDFYLDETRPEVQDFVRRFRLLTGETPDLLDVSAQRLAYTGYDVARFLIQTLPPDLSGGLREALREARRYEGLGLRIDFAEGNVNEALFYHRYRGGAVELLR